MTETFLARPALPPKSALWWLSRAGPRLRYVAGVAILFACLGVSYFLEQAGLSIPNIVMFFVLAVAVVATGFGTGPSIVAAVLASAMLAYFFLPPRFSFAVSDIQQVIMLVIMSILAVLISSLTDLVRAHAVAAERHAARIEAMFGLSSVLAGCTDVTSIVRAGGLELSRILGRDVFVLLPHEDRLTVAAPIDPGASPPRAAEIAAAESAFRGATAGGRDALRAEAAHGIFVMSTGADAFGVIVIRRPDAIDDAQLQLLSAMAQQMTDAIDRERLVRKVRATQAEAETERLRAGLLSSITHDLRTPLAIITGAATSLLDSNLALPHESMVALCQNIVEYSQSMARLVDNLLSMTRIESGFLQLEREMQVVEDVIGAALTHMQSRWSSRRRIKVDVPSGLALVPLDAVLFQQVLVNLLENADVYSPVDAPIEVSATSTTTHVVIEVADRGPGLAPGEESRIFEKFYRGHAARKRSQGSGLGLTICRAIVASHQGTIAARNRSGGGLTVRVELPLTPPEPSRPSPSLRRTAPDGT